MKSNRLSNKELLIIAIYCLGYFTLVGPPRAITMQEKLEKHEVELFGKPLWVVFIAELSLRGSLFVLFGFVLELIIGDALFEKLHGNLMLMGLFCGGGLHMFVYYIGIGVVAPKKRRLGMIIYRLGRNISYSIVCTYFYIVGILFYQYLNQVRLFSGLIIENSFIFVFFIFTVLGFLEAVYVKENVTSMLDKN